MPDIGTDILSLPIAIGLDGQEWVPLVQGGTTKRTQAEDISLATITGIFPASIEYLMFGNGSVIATGVFGTGLQVPFNCSIAGAVMNADRVGSLVVDIWKCTEAQYDAGATHPVVGDSITGGNPLTISAGTKTTSSLVGWGGSLNTGDWLWYNVNSAITIQGATISLRVSRVIP